MNGKLISRTGVIKREVIVELLSNINWLVFGVVNKIKTFMLECKPSAQT